jgi:hypothetical protein
LPSPALFCILIPMAPDPSFKEEPAFYEIAGALHSALISPGSSIMKVGDTRKFKILARDKSRRVIESGFDVRWSIREGQGTVSAGDQAVLTFTAPPEPGLTVLEATVTQGETSCKAEAIVTVTDSLAPREEKAPGTGKGLPS